MALEDRHKKELLTIEVDHNYARKENKQKDQKVYLCTICEKTFEDKDNLNEHIEKQCGNKCQEVVEKRKKENEKQKKNCKPKNKPQFKCDKCPKQFFFLTTLSKHAIQVHSSVVGRGPYRCKICFLSFQHRSRLIYHERNVHLKAKNYQCDICEFGFRNKISLIRHIKGHTDSSKFKCDECGQVFKSKSGLTSHEVVSHNKIIIRKKKRQANVQCSVCLEYFTNMQGLKFHKIKVHNQFHCKKCDIVLKSREDLNNHKTEHEKEFDYQCQICFRRFSKQFGLTNHINYQHEYRPHNYQCEICFKNFDKYVGLKNHIYRMHENERNILTKHKMTFQCTECGLIYNSSYLLSKHQVSAHTNAEIPCPYCGKLFKTKSSLSLHENIVHGECDKKCDVCGKSFATDRQLRRHHHTHYKRYICEYCGKKFGERAKLAHHELIHTNIEALTCPLCNKVLTKRRIKDHIANHAGIKKFSCEHCGKQLGSNTALKYHLTVKKCGEKKLSDCDN